MDKRIEKITTNEFRTDANDYLNPIIYADKDLDYKIQYVLRHLNYLYLEEEIEFNGLDTVYIKFHINHLTYNIECKKCMVLAEIASFENNLEQNRYMERIIYTVVGE